MDGRRINMEYSIRVERRHIVGKPRIQHKGPARLGKPFDVAPHPLHIALIVIDDEQARLLLRHRRDLLQQRILGTVGYDRFGQAEHIDILIADRNAFRNQQIRTAADFPKSAGTLRVEAMEAIVAGVDNGARRGVDTAAGAPMQSWSIGSTSTVISPTVNCFPYGCQYSGHAHAA